MSLGRGSTPSLLHTTGSGEVMVGGAGRCSWIRGRAMGGERCGATVPGWELGAATGGKDKGEKEEWGWEREESGERMKGPRIDHTPFFQPIRTQYFQHARYMAPVLPSVFPPSTGLRSPHPRGKYWQGKGHECP